MSASPGRPRLTHAELSKLSGLMRGKLDAFMETWPEYAVGERRRATKTLIELTEDAVELDFNDLFRRLVTDTDAEVRALAVEGLWEDDRPGTGDGLIELVSKDPAESVRLASIEGLGRFAFRLAIGDLRGSLGDRIRQTLLDLIGGPPGEARRRAVEAGGFLSEEPFRQAIRSAYAAPDARFQASALRAMGRSADEIWLDTILRELRSEEPMLRFEAARAAGGVADERAVPAIMDAIEDEDTEVRLAAIEALGAIGGQRARQALHRLRQGRDPALAEAAEDALDDLDTGGDPLGARIREINPN